MALIAQGRGNQGRAMIDWKKIRKRAETVALLSIMAAGYLAPALTWSATDLTTRQEKSGKLLKDIHGDRSPDAASFG